jgi:hypothetical protein
MRDTARHAHPTGMMGQTGRPTLMRPEKYSSVGRGGPNHH